MMVRTKLPQYLVALSAPMLLQFITILGCFTTAQAQTQNPTQTASDRRLALGTFEPRQDQPAPTMTAGGGRRGTCSQEDQTKDQSPVTKTPDESVIPLLPKTKTKLGLTVSAHPTFLVYVPKTSAKTLEFTLFAKDKDNSEKGIYQTTINLTNTPGIISFSLPTTEPPLEIGQDYKWIVAMACQPGELQAKDPFAEGLIRRIQPDSSLSRLLDKALPLEQVALYAKNGIWFEALANLAQLRQSQPNDPKVTSAWEDLLKVTELNETELKAIATAPLKK